MSARPRRHSHRRDEIEGFRPAVLLAVGLGLITSSVAMGLLAVWLVSISAAGGFGSGAGGLIAAALVWSGFWIGLSLGLAAALMLGFRAWMAAYPTAQRNAAQHRMRAERRAAIAEAEAVLRGAEAAHHDRPHEEQ